MKPTNLALMCGNELPFPQGRVNIHQPRLKEIAAISQATFFSGCQLLQLDKSSLLEKDKIDLEKYSNFDIIMSIMREKEVSAQKAKISALLVLTLLFPNYTIHLEEKEICLEKEEMKGSLNNENFPQFQSILKTIFCVTKDESQDYNPMGEGAKRLIDKFKQSKAKKAQLQAKGNEAKEINVFGRYISILAVGEQKDLNILTNYTIFQLMDQYNRYMLKYNYDLNIQQRLAGAKDVPDVDHWFKDLYSKEASDIKKQDARVIK